MTVRQCSDCQRSLPESEEFFAVSRRYKGKVYLLRRCRDCVKAYDRARGQDPERREAHRLGTARRRSSDSAGHRQRHKAWRDANPDKVRALWNRNYERNGSKHREKNKRWREANPELRRVYRRNRRAREENAAGSHTVGDIKAICRKQRHLCFYCKMKKIEEIDHFIPLKMGGTNYPDNLRATCRSCNRRKGAKLPWEWMPDRFQPLSNFGPR